MKDTKRTATVRAKTVCYMAKLTLEAFETVTTKYPEQQVAFLSLAQTRLTQDAVRSVLGVEAGSMSGESFTQRLEHVLKHAIGDKNREVRQSLSLSG
jgi:CRP-like cAMP-binding protein